MPGAAVAGWDMEEDEEKEAAGGSQPAEMESIHLSWVGREREREREKGVPDNYITAVLPSMLSQA